jgi:hypothetical protein
MKLKALTELNWRWYQNGKAQANDQHLRKQDIAQKIKLLFADAMRQRYYESKRSDEFGRPDYSFVSPILSVLRFTLGEESGRGMRRVDMSSKKLYRLPYKSHFSSVYPVSSKDCTNDEDVTNITQVQPSEVNFYVNNPDLRHIPFYAVINAGIDTYNIPSCVKELDVEVTCDAGDDTDIDDSIASVITDQILGVALGIRKQFYSEEVRKEMESQNIVKS